MSPIIRNVIGVVVGLVLGSIVNIGIVTLGPSIIPPPAGMDATDPESIAASMHLFETRHFITPFLAHALGTLVGAALAFLIAASNRSMMAYIVGAAFFAGGIMAARMLPAPLWFEATDLVLAYFPMAWLGQQLAQRFAGDEATPQSAPDAEA